MKNLLFTSVVCGFLLTNCHSPFPKNEEKNTVKLLNYDSTNVDIIRTSIDISTEENWHYGIEEVAGKPYLYYLDYAKRKLHYIDLKTKKESIICSFALPDDFYIDDFEILDEAKYFSICGFRDNEFDSDNKLYAFNFEGELIFEKKLPYESGHFWITSRHMYEYEMADLYTYYFLVHHSDSTNTQNYNLPIEGKWDAKNDLVEMLPIYYPDIYKTHFFGLSDMPNKAKVNDSIYAYTFTCYDSIYLYNRNTQSITKKLMNSKEDYHFRNIPYGPEMAKYNERAEDELYKYNTIYMGMNYMPKAKVFARYLFLRKDVNKPSEFRAVYYNDKFEYLGESDKTFDIEIDNNLYHLGFQNKQLDAADTSKNYLTFKLTKLQLDEK